MLTIPANINLKRSKKAERLFLGRLRKWLEEEKRSDGIHASELLDPRMGYWSRNKPKPLTDREVMMFSIGKGYHERFLPGIGSDSGQKVSSELGIEYSPDEIRESVPRELKTTRSFYAPKTQRDIELYLEQLQIYMVAEKSSNGGLDVIYLNLKDKKGKTCPAVRSYSIEYTDKQLEQVFNEIKETVALIQVAQAHKTPEILPLCRSFKCGLDCKWWEDCKPEGRYPEEGKRKWSV